MRFVFDTFVAKWSRTSDPHNGPPRVIVALRGTAEPPTVPLTEPSRVEIARFVSLKLGFSESLYSGADPGSFQTRTQVRWSDEHPGVLVDFPRAYGKRFRVIVETIEDGETP